MTLGSGVHAAVSVAYVDSCGHFQMVENPYALDARSALAALGSPIVDKCGNQLASAIPTGTRLIGLHMDGNDAMVDFSREILGNGLSESRLDTICEQVRLTMDQFIPGCKVSVLVEGRPIALDLFPMDFVDSTESLADPADFTSVVPTETGALSGHSMTLSPGHGIYWTGSAWETQRPVYGAPLNEEDFHNLEMCQYLMTYLKNDGMSIKTVRCMDKSYGDCPSGMPWWKMAACYWLQKEGYPGWVYGSFHPDLQGSEEDQSNDIRCRPLASNYDNTEIYVSIHTNGYKGDTSDTKPSGTEVYYDGNPSRTQWADAGKDLATKIADSVIGAIKENYDSSWTSVGDPVKNSDGRYGEIRLPERPAVLLELGFHDTCGRDAMYLRDNFFRSLSMWGVYKGICDYFGVTPSWDLYSYQYISDSVPSKMVAGREYNVSITFKNRGVLWTEDKQIRLGLVYAGSFETGERQYITGEVGPDDTYTFTFPVKAADSPGVHTISWRMLREGMKWFGPIVTKRITIISANNCR